MSVRRAARLCTLLVLGSISLALIGCAFSAGPIAEGGNTTTGGVAPGSPAAKGVLGGRVYGAQSPVTNAAVTLWAAGTTGSYGTGATVSCDDHDRSRQWDLQLQYFSRSLALHHGADFVHHVGRREYRQRDQPVCRIDGRVALSLQRSNGKHLCDRQRGYDGRFGDSAAAVHEHYAGRIACVDNRRARG